MKNYQTIIGDGQLPNKYFVFQYDEKFRVGDDGLVPIKEAAETEDSFLGEFKTYKEAVYCFNDAYLPRVVIEDRLTGVILETICIKCPCCGKEDYETFEDTRFTKEKLAENGIEFV